MPEWTWEIQKPKWSVQGKLTLEFFLIYLHAVGNLGIVGSTDFIRDYAHKNRIIHAIIEAFQL